MNKLEAFISLANLFNKNGFRLYLVGGSVRDYLLTKEINDLDVTSDATPEDIKKFYKDKATYTFEKLGAVTLYYESYKFDLTTLRKEEEYLDSRHPNKIIFVKELEVDVKRRDFTINAIYMDKNLKIYDFVDGVSDLNKKVIRMIGNPDSRIKEDPLRILRAIRFQITFNFILDNELKRSIVNNIKLLDNLKIQKIQEEIKKMKKSKESLIPIFKDFHILYLLDMVK